MSSCLRVWRRVVSASVLSAAALTAAVLTAPVRAEPMPSATTVNVDQVRIEAISKLLAGDLDQTGELLERASAASSDQSIEQMSSWVSEFRARQDAVREQKQKDFDKAVADAHKLLEADEPTFAAEQLAVAFLHAADREAFKKEPWASELLGRITTLASEFETQGQWLPARRLYGVMGSIEPTNPQWRRKINDVSRRIRLLGLYAPEVLQSIYDAEVDRANAAARITDPDAKLVEKSGADDTAMDDAFKLDWKKVLEGVNADMLRDALEQARTSYHRMVSPSDMIAGGVRGLRELLTTPGLEATFASLSDVSRRDAFLTALDELPSAVAPLRDTRQLRATVDAVIEVNKATLALPNEVIVAEFADGAFSSLDPHSTVIWPWDVQELQKSTAGEFVGVGIQINQDDAGWLTVVSPIEDTPAYRAGVKPGDQITHINGKNAKGVNVTQAVKHITGPQGTSVTLTIRSPDGESRELTLTRDVVKVASIRGWVHLPGGGWDYLIDPSSQIGYVRLTSFTRETAGELALAVARLQQAGARAMILDMRYNGGGVFQAATAVVDRFVADGTIVSRKSERDPTNQSSVRARLSADDLAMPLVVLVNQSSASASEIVAGAFKDFGRGVIIGERSFGKGSVQELIRLANGSAYLKLTTSHYYLPSGRGLHRDDDSTTWGVEPDLTIAMTPEQMRTANKARLDLDILRDRDATQEQLERAQKAQAELLEADPQLSAALLVLRMQLAGAPVI
jgi:carboxyl-terminal processing protease